jgi:hypothetical protein
VRFQCGFLVSDHSADLVKRQGVLERLQLITLNHLAQPLNLKSFDFHILAEIINLAILIIYQVGTVKWPF